MLRIRIILCKFAAMNIIKAFIMSFAIGSAACAFAQTNNDGVYNPHVSAQTSDSEATMDYISDIYSPQTDSLCLPRINTYGQVDRIGYCPYSWRNGMAWDLHEGLNLNVGLSVFAQLGKHSYGGVGFTQDLSALYVKPISSHLSLAVGGYLSNINWAHDAYRDAGFSAIVGYRFDEHWEAFLYGQKSLTDKRRMPYSLWDMQQLGDRIGASVRYNVNPSMSIEVSVERRQ